MRFATVPLGEVCAQDRASVRAGDRSELRYLGMESIESQSGALAKGELSKTPDVPEANSFLFTQAHVLYGKLRPYLNKVHVPAFDGKCSTELVPLRPSKELQREYLAYFLRAPSTVERISQRVAGARMPRADMNFVMSLPIPLPPQDEQRRIVDLLSRAENIVRMRREAEAKAKEIIPALFTEMFGDPIENPRHWDTPALNDIGIVQLGRQRAPQFQTGQYRRPYMRVANVLEDRIDVSSVLSMDFDDRHFAKYRLRFGDILLNEGQSLELVGRPAMWRDEIPNCCYQKTLILFRPDPARMVPEFALTTLLLYYLRGVLAKISSKTSNVAHLSAVRFEKLTVPCPPLELQMTYAERYRQLYELRKSISDATQTSAGVFRSLLAGVFGET